MRAGLLIAGAAILIHVVLGLLQASDRLPADARWFDRRTRGQLWDEGIALRGIARTRSAIHDWLASPNPEADAAALNETLWTTYYGLSSRLTHAPDIGGVMKRWDEAVARCSKALGELRGRRGNLTAAREACAEADAALKGIHDRLTR